MWRWECRNSSTTFFSLSTSWLLIRSSLPKKPLHMLFRVAFPASVRSVIIPSDAFLTNKQGFPVRFSSHLLTHSFWICLILLRDFCWDHYPFQRYYCHSSGNLSGAVASWSLSKNSTERTSIPRRWNNGDQSLSCNGKDLTIHLIPTIFSEYSLAAKVLSKRHKAFLMQLFRTPGSIPRECDDFMWEKCGFSCCWNQRFHTVIWPDGRT